MINRVRVKLARLERAWLDEDGDFTEERRHSLNYRVQVRVQEATSRAGRPVYVRYDLRRARIVSAEEAVASTRPAVLVVEDTTYWREKLTAQIEALGLEVHAVSSVDGALEWAAVRSDPYIVCLDLELPEGSQLPYRMSGFELLSRLQAERPTFAAFILSVHDRVDMRAEAVRRQVRVDDFISKADPDWEKHLAERLWSLKRQLSEGSLEVPGEGPPPVIRWNPDARNYTAYASHRKSRLRNKGGSG